MIKKIRHIGIIPQDFDATLKRFEGYGLACNEVIEREADGMRIAFFPVGDTLLEFLSFSRIKAGIPSIRWSGARRMPSTISASRWTIWKKASPPFRKTAPNCRRGLRVRVPMGGWPFFCPKRRTIS